LLCELTLGFFETFFLLPLSFLSLIILILEFGNKSSSEERRGSDDDQHELLPAVCWKLAENFLPVCARCRKIKHPTIWLA